MAKFNVWCVSDGDTEEDGAVEVVSFDYSDAAEEGARQLYHNSDHFTEATMRVRCTSEGGGEVEEFVVSVDFEPTFFASRTGTVESGETPR